MFCLPKTAWPPTWVVPEPPAPGIPLMDQWVSNHKLDVLLEDLGIQS